MKVEIRQSFVKDALKLQANIQKEIANVIITIENIRKLSELPACKKLKGYKNSIQNKNW